jgi:hypothetical protein
MDRPRRLHDSGVFIIGQGARTTKRRCSSEAARYLQFVSVAYSIVAIVSRAIRASA